MKILSAIILSAMIFIPFSAAKAQEDMSSNYTDGGWEYSVGAGALYSPTYLGDDEYRLMLVPDIRVTYQDKFFASISEGVGYNVINNEKWRAGPILKLDFGRDDDGESFFSVSGDDTNDLRGLGDVDTAAEIGGFIEYNLKPFVTKFELRQALGGHEGLVADLGLYYKTRTQYGQTPVFVSFGPEIKFASEDYHDAYFGVNAGQSARSGLAQYNPDGGVLFYGVTGSARVPMSDQVSAVLFAKYGYLGDESRDSSLVRQRGEEAQGTIGVFLNYKFTALPSWK